MATFPTARDDTHRAKGSSPLGTTIFVGLRALDPLLQYGILARAWGDPLIGWLGGTPLPMEGVPVALGLPAWRLTLFGMALAGALKGVFYLLAVSEGAMPVRTAVFVGVFKALSTTINSLLFCAAATSAARSYLAAGGSSTLSSGPLPLPPLLAAAGGLFVLGMFVEAYSEIQRKAFKAHARNKGKPYTGGLFSLARHINYGGYTVWKGAYGLAAGGWWWGALTLLWLAMEFKRRGIPALDAYCQTKYDAAWTEFKRSTPHKLFPFLY